MIHEKFKKISEKIKLKAEEKRIRFLEKCRKSGDIHKKIE